jgi:hypothetical protein
VKAKYTIFIPSEAKNVAYAAHHYLAHGPLATGAATVHHGHPFDTLIVFAEDTPEIDSHIKQLGAFVGEVANTQSIHVTKETGKAVHTWELANPYYTPPAASPMMQPQGPQALGTPPFAIQGPPTPSLAS